MKIEYLLFNFFILLSSTTSLIVYPAVGVVHKRAAALSISLVAIPFILTDQFATDWFWWFNKRYISGYMLGEIPLEEVMFFFCIPWACLLVWQCLQEVPNKTKNLNVFGIGIKVFLFVLSSYAVLYQLWYTAIVSALCFLATWYFSWKKIPLNQILFVIISILLTAVFNMYLTARPVVLYNSSTITNIRVGTIPIEDFLYGLLLLGSVIFLYEKMKVVLKD